MKIIRKIIRIDENSDILNIIKTGMILHKILEELNNKNIKIVQGLEWSIKWKSRMMETQLGNKNITWNMLKDKYDIRKTLKQLTSFIEKYKEEEMEGSIIHKNIWLVITVVLEKNEEYIEVLLKKYDNEDIWENIILEDKETKILKKNQFNTFLQKLANEDEHWIKYNLEKQETVKEGKHFTHYIKLNIKNIYKRIYE